MPSWNELLNEFDAQPPDKRGTWIDGEKARAMSQIGTLRGGRNVLFYASGFLQKPQAPAPLITITHEDINGFMSCLYGMKWDQGLTMILHTPGGITNAAETIVAYLRSKFEYLEIIVPAFAISAGTMISLAADRIVMGRQSQLGPIDPQTLIGGRAFSAGAIVDQFDRAKQEILANVTTAHIWAPILASMGPALLQEAQNALQYGERMVARWLKQFMFRNLEDPETQANATAAHFNDTSVHKSHGRRIDREEAREHKVVVEDLEADQKLQEAVLTAYHLVTITFERTICTKLIETSTGRRWYKNWRGGGGTR